MMNMELMYYVVGCLACTKLSRDFKSLKAAKKYARLLVSLFDEDDVKITAYYNVKF